MKIYSLIVITCCVFANSAFSQEEKKDEELEYEGYEEDRHIANLGFGLGLDYGGIGAQLGFLPTKSISIFGSIGYNLNGAAGNGGIAFLLSPNKKVCPKLAVMYGYNAVIVVQGTSQYNKTYYGSSVGGGIHLNTRNNQNFINIELFVPFRSSDYSSDLKALKNNSSITGIREPLPITFSIGYHIRL
jgi:hypothetical protein